MCMTHDEMIAVIQAAKAGCSIQFQDKDGGTPWETFYGDNSPSWNFNKFRYRVKPEPAELREWWIYMHDADISSVHPARFMSREMAERGKCATCTELLHVREVLEETSVPSGG